MYGENLYFIYSVKIFQHLCRIITLIPFTLCSLDITTEVSLFLYL